MSDGIHFLEGFEGDEDSLVWEAMGLIRDGDFARSGDFGIGHSGLGFSRSESPLFPPTTGVIVGFAFRYRQSGFGGTIPLFELRGPGDVPHMLLNLDAQSLLSVYSHNAAGELVPRAYSTRQLDENAFYYLEVAVSLHATAGRIVVQLNGGPGAVGETGGEIIDISGIRTVKPGLADPQLFYNQFHVGVMGGFSNESRDFSFDDFYVRDIEDGFLGDQAVIALALEDDRAVAFTRLSGPKNYQMLDEIAPDEDTTYNESDVDEAEDVFEVADSTFAGTIHAVQLVARAKKTQSQVWTLKTLLDLGGVKSYGTEYYLSYPDYETLAPDVFGDAPGETGWTLAQLNAIGVGYRAETPDVRLRGL